MVLHARSSIFPARLTRTIYGQDDYRDYFKQSITVMNVGINPEGDKFGCDVDTEPAIKLVEAIRSRRLPGGVGTVTTRVLLLSKPRNCRTLNKRTSIEL
jgi:5,10-methylene-tetrahydrofolate dehydrogenase/methenyl tetrahydrofolate cyclohydrolase